MTPFEIGIALHYHSRVEDCDQMRAPIGGSTMSWFVDNGLLTFHQEDLNQKYHPTDKLHAYVQSLEEMPLPVQKWVHPNEFQKT